MYRETSVWGRTRIACIGIALVFVACRTAPTSDKPVDPAPSPSVAAPAGTVLAQFGDRALTVAEFEARLSSLPPEIRAQYAEPAARERLLNDMVRLELLYDEAKRRGVDRSPSVKVRVSELVVEEMMNGLFGSEAIEAAGITEDEIRRYYDAHAAEFRSPAGLRTLDDVRTLIRSRLSQEKRREAMSRFTDELRARAQPRVYLDHLPKASPAPRASAGR